MSRRGTPEWTMPSPFVFDGPVKAGDVWGRTTEVDSLRQWMLAGRFVRLEAPRRFGKTSVINQLEVDLDKRDGVPLVHVDLYGVLGFHDLAVRLGAAYNGLSKGRLRMMLDAVMRSGIGVGLNVFGSGANLQFAQQLQSDPVPTLHALLELPKAIAEQSLAQRVVVALDEFQEVRNVAGADALLRSHIQHQREFASYLFAGSDRGMLEMMFADKTLPLFGQAEVKRLGRLDPGVLADHIEVRFQETNRSAGTALASLLDVTLGHPQRSMLLAHHLWTHTPIGSDAGPEQWVAALDACRTVTDPESGALWSGLTPNQQKALRAISQSGKSWRRTGVNQYGLKRGSLEATLEQLINRAELDEDTGTLRIVDPLFELWLRDLGEPRPRPSDGGTS